jgi:hypothetical protein
MEMDASPLLRTTSMRSSAAAMPGSEAHKNKAMLGTTRARRRAAGFIGEF